MAKTALVFMTATLTLSGTASSSTQETRSLQQPFYQTATEDCTLSASQERPGSTLRLNIGRKDPDRECAFTRAETIKLFSEILDAQAKSEFKGSYSSLLLGSLSHYGWMQRYLMETARRDENWSQKTGKPLSGHENSYVDSILNQPEIINVFNKAGAKQGFRFSAASCEKVFISEAGLPYDAFCWIEMTPE